MMSFILHNWMRRPNRSAKVVLLLHCCRAVTYPLKLCRFLTLDTDTTIIRTEPKMQFPNGLKLRAQSLLEMKPGSFTKNEYATAHDVLNRMLKSKFTDLEALNLGISLVERLAKELGVVVGRDKSAFNWFPNLRLKSLLEKWRDAILAGHTVVSPRAMVQLFNEIFHHVPVCDFNKQAYAYAMDVVIRKASSYDAPTLAEELLDFIRKESRGRAELRPNCFTYSRILQAWSVSDREEAPAKMEELIQIMLHDGIPPDAACYHLLLRYYAKAGQSQEVEMILQTMENRGFDLSIFSISQAVYVYSNCGQLDKAEDWLKRLMKLQPRDVFDKRNIAESFQNLMSSYRKLQGSSEFSIRENALNRAEEIFHARAMHKENIDRKDFSKLVGTMADIYVRAGRQNEAESILAEHGRADTVSYNILMKGKSLEDATAIVDNMLLDRNVHPSLHSFNSLLSLWAHSTKQNKVQQSFRLYEILKHHQRCRELGLQPDEFTYTILLKCLSTSYDKDCGKRALQVVHEMMSRSQDGKGHTFEPDRSIFSCAIRTCVQAKDQTSLEVLLSIMEGSNVCPPNVRDYNHLMNIYAKLRLPEACESLLSKMKKLSKSKSPEIHPNVVSYSLVINAWARSNVEHAPDKVWSVYEAMRKDEISLDTICYTRLLQILSGTRRRQMITRAEYLLDCMEKDPEIKVDDRHYNCLLKGWLDMQDVELASQIFMRQMNAHLTSNDPSARIFPDAANFHALIVAWIRIGHMLRATEFLFEVQRLHDEEVIPIGVNVESVKYLLYAWKYFKHPDRREAMLKLSTILHKTSGNDTTSSPDHELEGDGKIPSHA